MQAGTCEHGDTVLFERLSEGSVRSSYMRLGVLCRCGLGRIGLVGTCYVVLC
jgi:hypothetical protein